MEIPFIFWGRKSSSDCFRSVRSGRVCQVLLTKPTRDSLRSSRNIAVSCKDLRLAEGEKGTPWMPSIVAVKLNIAAEGDDITIVCYVVVHIHISDTESYYVTSMT